ncbi:MAG TPA: hypothetical protein VF721_11550 [Pyrinomonadaceae bacterium]|jgi:hypothetical protein
MGVVIGVIVGIILAALSYFLVMFGSGASTTALITAAACAGIGGVYSGIAFGKKIYGIAPLSLFGYFLDMTWSLLNTTAALLVWLPVSAAAGGTMKTPDANSQRSGAFVFPDNPRGGGYSATTIGTVIAGGWNSHEETHVWQARLTGPFYLIVYVVSFLLNVICRAVTGKTNDLVKEAYYRICFEDWAYWGGGHGSDYSWGGWVGGMFLTFLFIFLLLLIPIGIITGNILVWVGGIVGAILYSLIRNLAPRGH